MANAINGAASQIPILQHSSHFGWWRFCYYTDMTSRSLQATEYEYGILNTDYGHGHGMGTIMDAKDVH